MSCDFLNKFGAIRGYHVYNINWNPTVGEILSVKQERANLYDRYAVAVLDGHGKTIGHIPRQISRIVWWF